MEPWVVENLERYNQLVASYVAPSSDAAANDTTAAPGTTVAMRIRPMIEDEVQGGFAMAVFPSGDQPGAVDIHELKRPVRGQVGISSLHLQADRVYGVSSSTEDIYQDVVKPLIPWVWDGGIGTLFAYGQTGSGKTFTVSRLESMVAKAMFDGKLEEGRLVFVTIIELGGNAARDLLNDCASVAVLQDAFGNTQLNGARECPVTTADEMINLIEKATSFRRTAVTDKNPNSSRSHAICRIRVQNVGALGTEDGLLYLVDLAGSEEARDSVTHGAQRLKETREINKSLSVLKDCIRGKANADALDATGSLKKNWVPYRHSALTKVLKHVFDPATARPSKTVVIGCVSPTVVDVKPSRNTLRYAETLRVMVPKAKEIHFHPEVPMTWSNEQLKDWIAKNSGTPPVSGAQLAPFESGIQLLRLPATEFERRCCKTKGVSLERARALQSKLWQMHVDSQRDKPEATNDESEQTGRTDSADPTRAHLPFKQRLRPGMVVSWSASDDPDTKKMGAILCPIPTPSDDSFTGGFFEHEAEPEAWAASSVRYRCALVLPGETPGSYDVHLWNQVDVDIEAMDAEVILSFNLASRHYFIEIGASGL